jgi:hypothetical protein
MIDASAGKSPQGDLLICHLIIACPVAEVEFSDESTGSQRSRINHPPRSRFMLDAGDLRVSYARMSCSVRLALR